MLVKKFTFNGFQENTYIVYTKSGNCVIIDPGCFVKEEEQELLNFIFIAVTPTHKVCK